MRSLLKIFLNPGVLFGALGLGLFFTMTLLVALWYSRPEQVIRGASTAVVNIIRVPTATPTTPPISNIADLTPTVDLSSYEPGLIQVGGFVEVTGTGGAGLRVRENPGLSQGVLFLANEGEALKVLDGPKDLDGYSWWHLVNPDDEERKGWAVVDYLRSIPPP